MKKLSIKPIVRPKFVLGILIFVFLSTTIFFYLLKKGEENLRVFTQKRLIITQEELVDTVWAKAKAEKELRVEKGRSKILNIELDQKKRELKVAANQIQQEIVLRRQAEAKLIETLEAKKNLEEEVKKFAKGPKVIELEKIIVRPIKNLAGEVIEVNKEHRFVVVNLGREDNLGIGDILSIYRDSELIGKARVEKVEKAVSAAAILPDWQKIEFKKSDMIKVRRWEG